MQEDRTFKFPDILETPVSLREELVVDRIRQGGKVFAELNEHLENLVNTYVYAKKGRIPEELLDMLWLTKGLAKKYGHTIRPEDSRQRIFQGKERSETGNEFLRVINQLFEDNFNQGATSLDFDISIAEGLHKYVTEWRYEGFNQGLDILFDDISMLEAMNRDFSIDDKLAFWEQIFEGLDDRTYTDTFVRISKEQRKLAAFGIGYELIQEAFTTAYSIYKDLLLIYGRDQDWVDTNFEGLISGQMSLVDTPLLSLSLSTVEDEDSDFAQFSKLLVESIFKFQNYIGNISNLVRGTNLPYQESATYDEAELQFMIGSGEPDAVVNKNSNRAHPIYQAFVYIGKKLFPNSLEIN